MKFIDINKRFTEKVAEYLAKGYTINTATMSGSQGEIGKVDLTNGVELIRINLRNDRGCEDMENGRDFYYDAIVLEVGRCTDGIQMNSKDTWQTFWTSHMAVIEDETFYQIGEYRLRDWYGTREEAIAAYNLKRDRFYSRLVSNKKEFGDEAKKVVLSYIKRQPKCKTVCLSDITKVTKQIDGNIAHYRVECRGKTYRLH